MLMEAISLRVYVIGKVNKTGVFPIIMKTTVLQVLSMAGGLNAFASEDGILILRNREGETVQIPFYYKEARKGKNLEQNIRIERWDVVVVPRGLSPSGGRTRLKQGSSPGLFVAGPGSPPGGIQEKETGRPPPS